MLLASREMRIQTKVEGCKPCFYTGGRGLPLALWISQPGLQCWKTVKGYCHCLRPFGEGSREGGKKLGGPKGVPLD